MQRSRFVLPAEAVADVVSFLDRLSIELALMVGRQITQAADDLLTTGNVPLRSFDSAGVCFRRDGSPFLLASLTDDGRVITFEDPDVWTYVIRWSTVRVTGIYAGSGIYAGAFETPVVTSSIWDRLTGCMKVMASAEQLEFCNVNLCPLSPAELKQISTFHFLQEISFDRCRMLSASLDNEFLRLISADRAHNLTLSVVECVPCDRATFAVDDDGILQFLCSGAGNYERKMEICHANATEQLPLRLESGFAAIQGEPQVELILVPRHSNHEQVIEATNRFRRSVDGPREVVYIHDGTPMSFRLIETRLTPSLYVMLRHTTE